jgi:hypothetical protein
MKNHLDNNVLGHKRFPCRQRIKNQQLVGVAPDPITNDKRPHKRSHNDPPEGRIGWGTLVQYVDALFWSSRKSPPITLGPDHGRRGNMVNKAAVVSFAKPYAQWNRWHTRKPKTKEKENPHSTVDKHARNEKSLDQIPKLAARPQFGPPIPYYSLDVDRNNDCFRPGLMGFKTFPIPSR